MSKKIRLIFGAIALVLLLAGASGCSQNAELKADLASPTNGKFIDYTEAEFNQLKGTESMVLFFHADWCGTCKILNDEINERIDEIPDEVKILKVNFDTEAELKKEYGILLQSMFVVLDKDGNIIEKLAAPDFDDLLASINSSL